MIKYQDLTDDQLVALARQAEWECNSDMWKDEGIEDMDDIDMSGYSRDDLLDYFGNDDRQVSSEHVRYLLELGLHDLIVDESKLLETAKQLKKRIGIKRLQVYYGEDECGAVLRLILRGRLAPIAKVIVSTGSKPETYDCTLQFGNDFRSYDNDGGSDLTFDQLLEVASDWLNKDPDEY